MGQLIDGAWSDEWYDTKSTGGRFVRKDSAFRDHVRADGSTRFAPEAGRYHLYVSLACPWAHRTLILRKLKGLEQAISVSVVDPFMGGGLCRNGVRRGYGTPTANRHPTPISQGTDDRHNARGRRTRLGSGS